MRNLTLVIYSVCLAASLSLAMAQDNTAPKKKHSSATSVTPAEQKKAREEILAKYDTNKDGKLDKQEQKKVTKADRETLRKSGLTRNGKGKKGAKGQKSNSTSGSSTSSGGISSNGASTSNSGVSSSTPAKP
jgi:hypothetical protein